MFGQQFVPNQVYGQPPVTAVPNTMLPYTGMVPSHVAAGGMAGTMMHTQPTYRGGFSPQTNGAQQQPPPPQQQQPPPPQQQQWPQQPNISMPNAPPPGHPPRSRSNDIGAASCVIHMRNVTPDVTQLSIQNLAANFGDIKHIVMLRQMNQALVEMTSKQYAEDLVNFFLETGYAEVDGRRVYIRYSNHQTLTATQHVSRTLLVSMFNTHYDVSAAAQITPEIVYQIFASYGAVQRIVVLPKNESSQWNHNRVQALVQFDSRETADYVKNTLQGQPVTLGETVTFTLDIQFSRMDEIKTTNPHTSIVVDEKGLPHRPIQVPPSDPAAMPAMAANGSMYTAVPQQWQ